MLVFYAAVFHLNCLKWRFVAYAFIIYFHINLFISFINAGFKLMIKRYFILVFFLLSVTVFSNPYYVVIDTVKADTVSITADSLHSAAYDSLAADSVKPLLKTEAVPDTLIPLYQQPFSFTSFFIKREEMLRSDYRSASDFFHFFGLNYLRDHGFVGYPNELLLYGSGYNGISYFKNGILFNNRYTNALDLNQIQTEDLDSIEILPSPRGFLYGPLNNPVSVNFITRDILSPAPYSRIKYYEGPYGEAMVDGMFSAVLYKKLIAYFDLTNRTTGLRYQNSAYSLWLAKVRLKYLLSNKINIIGSYGFVKSEVGLNGGIDAQIIAQSGLDINSAMYNIYASVVNPSRIGKAKRHSFNLKLLAEPAEYAKTDLSFYYQFDLNEIDNHDVIPSEKSSNQNKALGIALKQNYSINNINFQLLGNYEYRDLKLRYTDSTFTQNIDHSSLYSLAAVVSYSILDDFTPSVFIKHSGLSSTGQFADYNNNYNGYGFDLNYKLSYDVQFYLGASKFDAAAVPGKLTNMEAGVKLNLNNLKLNLKVFNNSSIYRLTGVPGLSGGGSSNKLTGLGANIYFNAGDIYLESENAFYTDHDKPNELLNNIPTVTSTTGLFYKDTLFNSNLHLKAGFVGYYTGARAYYLNNTTPVKLNPSFQLDFTLSGVIRKVAIIYFTFQNLFDNNYYLIPYYPMPPRSVRFGIAWEFWN